MTISSKNIAPNQYKPLKDSLIKIAQLSELNLVYLMVTQGASITKAQPLKSSNASENQDKSTVIQTDYNEIKKEIEKYKNPYIRRAQEYIDKNNYAKAVLELREGLKKEPNNVDIHALLGLSYIKEKQFPMARVHTKKALQSDSKNTIALECQGILNKMNSQKTNAQKTQKKSNSGLFGGLFGGKK